MFMKDLDMIEATLLLQLILDGLKNLFQNHIFTQTYLLKNPRLIGGNGQILKI